MREIGGYIELDTYSLPMLHENAIHLNCGRNALANAQEYFDMPIEDTDAIYTCRKLFGVADGAILYTNDVSCA